MKVVFTVLSIAAVFSGVVVAQEWQEVNVSGFTLRWATTSATELSVELSAPTTGWVAVGFDPTAGMQNGNILIGYVSGASVYIRDDFGVAPTSHAADTSLGGTNDFTIDGGSESGGTTEIQFTIPLNSGDVYDRVLDPGNMYAVILARGQNGADDFTSYHAAYASTEIELLTLALEPDTWGRIKTGY
ncbi:MAG: DOMON domain-containing protein [Candidatus Fermentibacteria bacterium]